MHAGEHRERIKALKEFALSEGPALAVRNLAMESLRICNLSLTPNGAVRLLESLKVLEKHEPIALLRAGIQIEFPEKVLAAAEVHVLSIDLLLESLSIQEAASGQIPDRDAEKRRDLTHLKVFSIDEIGTREIDDAIGVESLPNGQRKSDASPFLLGCLALSFQNMDPRFRSDAMGGSRLCFGHRGSEARRFSLYPDRCRSCVSMESGRGMFQSEKTISLLCTEFRCHTK